MLRLQRLVGNRITRAVIQSAHATLPPDAHAEVEIRRRGGPSPSARGSIQRAPAGFGRNDGLDVWKYTPGWTGWGETSPYQLLLDDLER